MKTFLLVPMIWVVSLTTMLGQADKNLKEQADQYAAALKHTDIETLIDFIYPRVVENFGGRTKMIAMMKERFVDMKLNGTSFDQAIIGQPSKMVKAGNEIHCLIPQTQVIKGETGKSKMESTLLAVTKDNGNHWYFISLENYTQESIKNLIPNYNPELKVPTKKPPQLMHN